MTQNFDIMLGSGVCAPGIAFIALGGATMTPLTLYRDQIPNLNSDTISRFLGKIDKTPGHGPNGDCWVWTAYLSKRGYGELTIRPNKFLAHRLSWILEHGYLESDLEILHQCDFPPCCRPDHLRKGTHLENMQDCKAKGRHKSGYVYGEKVGNHKLSLKEVLEIRNKFEGVRKGYKSIGQAYGVSDVLIGQILRGKIWKNTNPIVEEMITSIKSTQRLVIREVITQPVSEDYRLIPLTQGQVATVDVADFDQLMRYNWHAKWEPTSGSFYAARNSRSDEGKPHTIRMHSQIMGLKYGDGRTVDHIKSHETLDNRRSNLRIATKAEQTRNLATPLTNTSGYRGVTRAGTKWMAQISVDGKKIYLGRRDTPREAHLELYVPAVKEMHGKFARIR